MDFPAWLRIVILSCAGLCWTSAYCLIIYRSWKDKTYGMPFIALAFNICWEFLYSFIFVSSEIHLQLVINYVWFFLDAVILFFYFLYGKKDWRHPQSVHWFYPYSLFVITAAACLLWFFEIDFQKSAITYSAFMMNVLISALYIKMILARRSLSGQSFGIALFKLFGTLCSTLFLLSGFTTFLILLGFICFILDAVYLILVIRMYKQFRLEIITRMPLQLN
jgi:hypothetical protein